MQARLVAPSYLPAQIGGKLHLPEFAPLVELPRERIQVWTTLNFCSVDGRISTEGRPAKARWTTTTSPNCLRNLGGNILEEDIPMDNHAQGDQEMLAAVATLTQMKCHNDNRAISLLSNQKKPGPTKDESHTTPPVRNIKNSCNRSNWLENHSRRPCVLRRCRCVRRRTAATRHSPPMKRSKK